MKTEMIRAVFFDVDDTLLDFNRCAAVASRRTFAHFGLTPPAHTMETFFSINDALWLQIERGELSPAEHRRIRWNRIFKELGIVFDGEVFEEVFRKELTDSYEPVDGALELLRTLQPRYLLCVASNAVDAPSQRHRLARSGILPLVSHCFLSGEIGFSKPSPEYFSACFAALSGISPEEAFFVGDSPAADMAGGKAFGMTTCLFDPKGNHPHCPDADFTVRSLAQIPPLLFGDSCQTQAT